MRVDPFYIQTLSSALTDATATEAQLSTELSSGLRVSKLSSDPVAVAQTTVIGAAISADDAYVQAASSAQSKLQVTSSALAEVVSQVTQAVTLAVSGGNATLTPTNQATIGLQLGQIRDQVLAIANTSYLGQYIFAGSQGSKVPFQQSGPSNNATTTYVGDQALQYTTTENGQRIQTNIPGNEIFDAPGASILKTLNQVVADYTSGATSAQIASDAGQLGTALSAFNVQHSIINSSLSQIVATSTYAQTDASQLSAVLSALIASNPAKVATSLSNVQTQSQALDSVIAGLEKGSLFDYIK